MSIFLIAALILYKIDCILKKDKIASISFSCLYK